MAVKQYDPAQFQLIVNGNIISGFADGTFISFTRSADSFSKTVGSDGEVTRTRMNDKSAELTITLQQASASNDILSDLYLLDELSGNGIVPVLMKDGSGNTIIGAAEAWIRKPADATFSNEAENREWVIDMAAADPFIGGN